MRTGDKNIFSFYLPTKIIHGVGSVEEAGSEMKGLGVTKALVVTDKGVRGAGLLERVLASLDNKGIAFAVFDEVEEDPGGATVAKGAEVALKEGCNGIVAIGGGSPICAGRGVGVVFTNGGKIRDYAGLNKASKPPLPLIAIPTTAGSGAEVSQFILLKDEELNTKMAAGSPLYFPKVAILDPLLLMTLPVGQFATSGVDALAHAVEAYQTTISTPITDAWALQAVSMIHGNLRAAATTDDLDAKEACLIGSSLANMACGNARLALAHTMTIPVEARFHIPHGISVGILLPHVLEFNLPASRNRFAALARAMGEEGHSARIDDLAPRGITAIKKLLADLDFPRKYSTSQVDPEAMPEMAKIAMGGGANTAEALRKDYPLNTLVPSVNIRKTTLKEMVGLYEMAFQGWEL